MKVHIKGVDELIARIQRLPKQFADATAVGEFNAAQEVMKLSKSRAPFEFGALEKAAFVELPKFTAHGVNIEIGYHGVPYIEAQHETEWYSHPGKFSRTKNRARASQGQHRFLASALTDMEGRVKQVVAQAVAYFLKTGRLPKMVGGIKGKT